MALFTSWYSNYKELWLILQCLGDGKGKGWAHILLLRGEIHLWGHVGSLSVSAEIGLSLETAFLLFVSAKIVQTFDTHS